MFYDHCLSVSFCMRFSVSYFPEHLYGTISQENRQLVFASPPPPPPSLLKCTILWEHLYYDKIFGCHLVKRVRVVVPVYNKAGLKLYWSFSIDSWKYTAESRHQIDFSLLFYVEDVNFIKYFGWEMFTVPESIRNTEISPRADRMWRDGIFHCVFIWPDGRVI